MQDADVHLHLRFKGLTLYLKGKHFKTELIPYLPGSKKARRRRPLSLRVLTMWGSLRALSIIQTVEQIQRAIVPLQTKELHIVWDIGIVDNTNDRMFKRDEMRALLHMIIPKGEIRIRNPGDHWIKRIVESVTQMRY